MQEVADLERNLLLEELSMVVTHGRGNPASVDEARQWTLLQWTSELFPVSLLCSCMFRDGDDASNGTYV